MFLVKSKVNDDGTSACPSYMQRQGGGIAKARIVRLGKAHAV
jgi:hypothetical protein